MARKRRARVRYHSVRGGHYGSFGPRYLGYSMPGKSRYKRRRRTRSNPWYKYGAPYRNPGGKGGTNWLLIGGIAVGAFFLLKGGALGSIFGASAPAGYSSIGGGYYRGPDGALYQQNPSTGGMVRSATQAAPGSSVEQQLIAAGSRLAMPLLTGGVTALGKWLGSLWSGSGSGSATGALPSTPLDQNTSDVLFGSPGLAPLPALPELGLSDWWNTGTGSDWWNSSVQPVGAEPGYSLWGGEGSWLPDLPPLEPSVSISWVDPDFVGGYEPSGFWGLGQRRRTLPLAGYGRVLRRGPTGEVEARFMRAPASYR